VYFLLGVTVPQAPADSDDGTQADDFVPRSVAYIGQTGSLRRRFASHHRMNAADWSVLFLATTNCGFLNSAHAVFAEKFLTERADSAGVRKLINQTSDVHLDDGDRAFATEFAENVVVLAQILGADLFRTPLSHSHVAVTGNPTGAASLSNAPDRSSPGEGTAFEFRYAKKMPIPATMVVSGSRFWVKAGSKALDRAKIKVAAVADLRERAQTEGYLTSQPVGQFLEFVRDMDFSSPSAAGAIVYGSACAGPDAWWLPGTDVSYRQWLQARANLQAEAPLGNAERSEQEGEDAEGE
jgi:hypothetical protein